MALAAAAGSGDSGVDGEVVAAASRAVMACEVEKWLSVVRGSRCSGYL